MFVEIFELATRAAGKNFKGARNNLKIGTQHADA
jgi:hypothetical protein